MLTIGTGELLYKHSFTETLSDWQEANNYYPESDDIYLEDRVLVALIRKYVLPKISQRIEVVELDPPHHNPIRIETVNGLDIDWVSDDYTEYLDDFDYRDVEIPDSAIKLEFEVQLNLIQKA